MIETLARSRILQRHDPVDVVGDGPLLLMCNPLLALRPGKFEFDISWRSTVPGDEVHSLHWLAARRLKRSV
jgi:hypothetical protein